MTAGRGYTVLIDGYNVIMRHDAWRGLPLQAARRQLARHLEAMRWPDPIRSVTIVFDAREGDEAPAHHAGTILIRFATPSADALILETLRTAATARHLLIVSDDGELVRAAKSHGAVSRTVAWLLERGRPSSRPAAGKGAAPAPKTSLSAADARRITEELEKRWLKDR